MKITLLAGAAILWFSATVSAAEYPWKVLPPFEISAVDGYMEGYPAGEPFTFNVEGKSHVQIEAHPTQGFGLAATIYDKPRTRSFQSAKVIYDESKQSWQLTFTAPKDTSKAYEIEINLYCNRDESRCAEIYGIAAQASKVVPLYAR